MYFGCRHTRLAVALLGCVGLLATPLRGEAQVRATLVAGGFTRPVGFVQHPADSAVHLVLEQGGRVRVLRSGQVQSPDFIDVSGEIVSGGEQGLLGLVFAPDYATSNRVFLNFTNRSGHTVIARYTTIAGNAFRADPASRFDLVWPNGDRFITQPFANHNGGHLAFGPDGMLYIGLGDGGSGNDPMHLAQNPLSLLGKMLRIDVSVPASDREGYNVPPTNPFVNRPGVLGEIWSFGLRNPWRYSFDAPSRGGTGALIMADVGQGAWEEVNYEPAGASGRNYGWRNREGAHNNVTSAAPFSTPLVDPIHEYPHGVGSSITGGYVYRGEALGGSFTGRYFFADFVTSRVWSVALTVDASSREATARNLIDHTAALVSGAVNVSSFGEDAAGELYLVSYSGGIYRLERTGGPAGRPREGPIVGTAQPR
jgi:glucose/arabinose dehydrogenase